MIALVTGAGGFLGQAIVRQLLAQGVTVRTFQRGDYPALRALGVEIIRGDLADAASVISAMHGIDTVFHAAAKAGVWGRYRDYYIPNVVGTQNILDACRRAAVPHLIYTSSPSVVFSGADESGITESVPYPQHYLAAYPQTKARAEQLVRAANSPALATIALRPHLIWGPGDPHLIPRVIARARAGRLRLIGPGTNLVDTTYIDNAAAAHLAAAAALFPSAPCAGKAYFISNGEPLPMRDLLTRILTVAGLPPVIPTISPRLAYAAGALLEFTYSLLRSSREPPLTRFVARQLAAAHWFDLTAARRDLAYNPQVSLDEGFRRLAESLHAYPKA